MNYPAREEEEEVVVVVAGVGGEAGEAGEAPEVMGLLVEVNLPIRIMASRAQNQGRKRLWTAIAQTRVLLPRPKSTDCEPKSEAQTLTLDPKSQSLNQAAGTWDPTGPEEAKP
jgi:hypothetical protein